MQQRKRPGGNGLAIELQIDGEAWHRVESLEESAPDDHHFVATTDESGTTTLRFGDGEHGARLPAGTDQVVATYRSSTRFVAVVQQEGRVIVDRDWNEIFQADCGLCGLYRGIVVDNLDPTSRSRVQVQIDGVGDKQLWAQPCRPIGVTNVPAVGASVWVAFEGGDPSLPVWMGVTP